MRPTTNTKGETRADLSEPDRRTFARAKDLALEFSHYESKTERGKTAAIVACGLTTILKEPPAEAPLDDPDSQVKDADK